MIRFLSAALLLLTSLPLLAEIDVKQEIILADFSNDKLTLDLFQGEARGQKTVRAKGSDELRIQWENSGIRYWEWYFHKAPDLPRYTGITISTVLKKVKDMPTVNRVNLRLTDATGEVFQYPMAVDWGESQEVLLTWELTPGTKPSVTWGGNGDGKLDFPVRLLGASGEYKDSSGALRIGPFKAVVTNQMRLTETVAFELENPGPVNIVRPGRTQVKGYLRNRTLTPVNVGIALKLSSLDGGGTTSPVAQISLAPGERRQITLPELPEQNGIYYFDCLVSDPENPTHTVIRRSSVAVMTPAGPTPGRSKGFLFGICSHPNWVTDREIHRKEAEAMGLVGAKVLRVDIAWWLIERKKGTVDYSLYDDLVETFAAQGIEFDAILHQVPGWAETRGNLPDYEEWRRFARETFRRYQGKIRFWEIWNEPDLTSFATFNAPEYTELLKIAREEAQKNAPDALLLTGGFATMSGHGSKKEGFQEDTLRLAKGYYDIHAYHEHCGAKQFVQMVDERFLPMRRQLGVTAPWYANETAISSAHVSEKEQAVTLVQKLIFSWSRGSVGYNWYNLRNKGNDPKDSEQNYGMITSDFQPKAVFVAYNTLTTLLGSGDFLREIPVPEGMLFEFRSGSDRILCGWATEETGGRLLLRSGKPGAQQIDLMGNISPAKSLGEYTMLELTATPSFWRFPETEQLEVCAPPIRFLALPLAIPGNEAEFAVVLTSPAKKPLTFELAFAASAGVKAPEKTTVTLLPGEKKIWKGRFRTNSAVSSANSMEFLAVDCRIPELGYHDRIQKTLPVAKIIAESPTGKPADFLLTGYGQVFSLYSADPAKSHLLWSGPADLSAAIRLGATPEKLLIDVSVTDDVHHQPYRGIEVWRGDNIQLALEFPGQQGMWELGLTRLESGESECTSWNAPSGFTAEPCARAIKLVTERTDTKTNYRAEIPLAALGVDRALLRKGFRFNLLINDNDGEARKGWISIAPGIGEKKDSALYPFVLFP